MRRLRRRLAATLLLSLAAGCASFQPTPTRIEYHCDQGRQFAVSYAPDLRSAELELARMHFSLQREEPVGERAVQRFSCSTLTLTRNAELAALEIQGDAGYRNCRARE